MRYSYEPRLTPEVTGQFLRTKRGPVKLFAWSEPQIRLRRPTRCGSMLGTSGRCSCGPSALDAAEGVPAVRPRPGRLGPAQRREGLGPRARARSRAAGCGPGSYAFVATHEGMFGGRDFAYLRIVPPSVAVTVISSRPHAAAPAVLDALLPLCAALLALAFAALLLRSFLRRRSGEKVLWVLGFLFFALAAGCEAVAQRTGWSPALFRTYYLAGGVLTVAYLGAGSAWLLLPTSRARLARGRARGGDSGGCGDRRARRRPHLDARRDRSAGGRPRTPRSGGTHSSGRSGSTRSGACS